MSDLEFVIFHGNLSNLDYFHSREAALIYRNAINENADNLTDILQYRYFCNYSTIIQNSLNPQNDLFFDDGTNLLDSVLKLNINVSDLNFRFIAMRIFFYKCGKQSGELWEEYSVILNGDEGIKSSSIMEAWSHKKLSIDVLFFEETDDIEDVIGVLVSIDGLRSLGTLGHKPKGEAIDILIDRYNTYRHNEAYKHQCIQLLTKILTMDRITYEQAISFHPDDIKVLFPQIDIAKMGKREWELFALPTETVSYLLGFPIHYGSPSVFAILESVYLLKQIGKEAYIKNILSKSSSIELEGDTININNYLPFDRVEFLDGDDIFCITRELWKTILSQEIPLNPYNQKPLTLSVHSEIKRRQMLSEKYELPPPTHYFNLLSSFDKEPSKSSLPIERTLSEADSARILDIYEL
jgi:hypothetical protein